MKKFRQYFFKVKEGFLDAKNETTQPAVVLAYHAFIYAIYLILSLFPAILDEVFSLTLYAYIILAFDNIRDGFVQWCAERNAYCNPE